METALAATTVVPPLLCPSDGAAGRVLGSVYGATNFAANAGSGMLDFGTLKKSDGVFFTGSSVRFADLTDGATHTAAFSERTVGPGGEATTVSAANVGDYIVEVPAGSDPSPAACASNTGDANGQRGAKWILGNYGNTLYNHYYVPNASMWDCMNIQQQKSLSAARSNHSGGVNVQFCDGAIRYVRDDIDVPLWRAAATRNASELQ